VGDPQELLRSNLGAPRTLLGKSYRQLPEGALWEILEELLDRMSS